METTITENEEFGVYFFAKDSIGNKGLLKITVPVYNKDSDIIGFTDDIARFKKNKDALVASNDILGNFSKERLLYLYIALYGKKPIANTVKLLPKLKAKLLKFE